MSIWLVKVSNLDYHKTYKLNCKGSLKEGYQKAMHFATQKEQDYLETTGHKPHVCLISCSYAFKPVGEREFHGQLWCPYCRKWQFFFKHGDYDRCAGCDMTTEDFHIRRFNHLDLHLRRVR